MSDETLPVIPKLISTTAAAARYGLNVNTFRSLVRCNRLPPHYKIGGAVKFDVVELDAWFFGCRSGGIK